MTEDEAVCKLGEGAVITVMDGTTMGHVSLRDYMLEIAKTHDIKTQLDFMIGGGTDAGRMHLPKDSRIRLDKAAGKPRTIAPAKPSRPLLNQGRKALQSTPKMSAPALPKPTAIKPPITPRITPKVPRIRGGGKVGLALAALSGAGALVNAMNSKKK
jgi:hypothetical protein